MNLFELKEAYANVLNKFRSMAVVITPEQDKYSGVFLTQAFENYLNSELKVMIVGRETAGWNTNNGKGGIRRLVDKVKMDDVNSIVEESLGRYSKLYYNPNYGVAKKKSRSHFIRFFKKVATELNVSVDSIIYSNMLAWDYKKNSFKRRPLAERKILEDISRELLANQITSFKPNVIIFATGSMGYIDPLIKKLAKEYFEEHETIRVVKRKFWEFNIGNIKCFRIAHPRAQNGEHPKYRKELIEYLKAEQHSTKCK